MHYAVPRCCAAAHQSLENFSMKRKTVRTAASIGAWQSPGTTPSSLSGPSSFSYQQAVLQFESDYSDNVGLVMASQQQCCDLQAIA